MRSLTSRWPCSIRLFGYFDERSAPGILSGARRELELPAKALCVGGVFLIAGDIGNELVSVRVSPRAVAAILLHAARDVTQAKAVPCHVVAQPLA
jgi:hypothetical protein